jgi:hypothetical protein
VWPTLVKKKKKKKKTKTKFHKNSYSVSCSVLYEQTDKMNTHDKAQVCFATILPIRLETIPITELH